MMHITQKQEQFSNAYLHAIATVAGCTLATPQVDDDSIDFTISSKDHSRRPKLDIQLKCYMKDTCVNGSGLSYRLSRKNYDDLRIQNCLVPRVLIVVVVPRDVEDWLSQSDNEVKLRYCGYWASVKGEPQLDQEKITVKLPQANRVTPQVLNNLMSRIAAEGDL